MQRRQITKAYEERNDADKDPVGLDDNCSRSSTDAGSSCSAEEATHGENEADKIIWFKVNKRKQIRMSITVHDRLETVREDKVIGGARRLAVGLAVNSALGERVAV